MDEIAHLPAGIPLLERRFSRRRSVGLSMVELLVALVLLSIGSLAAVTMQRAAVKQNDLTDSRQTATWLARQLIEKAHVLRYADSSLATTSGFVNPPAAVSPANNLNALGQYSSSGLYVRKWQIDSPATNVKRIQVQISWNQTGQTDVLILKSYLKAR
jgi:type IV pilus assembly protein PilV